MDEAHQKAEQQHRENQQSLFDGLDEDKSGAISMDEHLVQHGHAGPFIASIANHLAQDQFLLFDDNGDGKLELDEYREMQDPHRSPKEAEYMKLVAAFELDSMTETAGSTSITWSEYHKARPGHEKARFDEFDNNKDDVLDMAEFNAYNTKRNHGHGMYAHEESAGHSVDENDPVGVEITFILNYLTEFKHQPGGEDPMEVHSIQVSLEQAKSHYEFFVGWHKEKTGTGHAEL
jgi:Ca2+-binding EF-hand superfamily protein